MCGLAVIARLDGKRVDGTALRRATEVLVHRGPDDSGHHIDGAVGMGFRRLSILDLTPTAHQPMRTDDGRLTLVFNGEIYNYVELRSELESRGHRFRSSGDTEVLLRAFEEWGEDCLCRLNGMWAFVVYDAHERRLFASRDRFGIKPLYRYRSDSVLVLASEIKAIRATGLHNGDRDWGTISRFLVGGRLESVAVDGETFFDGISALPAGSASESSLDGRYRDWRYWSLPEADDDTDTREADDFANLFRDSIRLRLRSDVTVGVSLSGGLDSSSIIGTMAELRRTETTPDPGSELHAFSYVDPEFDESAYIAETVKLTGAELHTVESDPARLWDQLGRVLWYHDEPLHSPTALVGFEIYRLAAKHGVRVLLSGQGADETLAGYPSYFRNHWQSLVSGGRYVRLWSELESYTELQGGNRTILLLDALHSALRWRLGRLPPYRKLGAFRHRLERRHESWFTGDLLERVGEKPRSELHLDPVLRQSVQRTPLPLYLRIEDRNSMAHSVEARLPFLDYRLVSLAFRLPAREKIRGPWTKWVLREATKDVIPETVRTRIDKMGFPTSSRRWFAEDLYDTMRELLSTPEVRSRGIYDLKQIRSDLERHRAGDKDVAKELFNFAQFERWMAMEPPGDSVVLSA